MTHKEIAERLRDIVGGNCYVHSKIFDFADELDPPRPEPGTVVWWRHKGTTKWSLGTVAENYDGIVDTRRLYERFGNIEWKPARIAGPMQMIVDVPPARMWSPDVAYMDILLSPLDADFYPFGATTVRHITRDEAERMEADR